MDKEIAIIALQKAVEKRKRRNELAKKMRERRGEELKEKNKEYVRIHREKKDVLPKELPIKKDLIRIEKDKGELISRVDRTGVKGVTEKTAINYMNKISVIHKIISKNELDKETLKRILLGNEENGDEKKILNNM